MNSFLEEVVEDIFNKITIEKLKDCTIILPTRRAGLHLKKVIAKKIGKPIILPKITTINEFILSLSKLKSISGFEAELALYSAYLEIKQNPEKLDGFIHLAPLILSDFNLIDKYLLDANQFISNINAVNEIENWSLNKKELTEYIL